MIKNLAVAMIAAWVGFWGDDTYRYYTFVPAQFDSGPVSGASNIGIGTQSLEALTTGQQNVAVSSSGQAACQSHRPASRQGGAR
jgi:hypothetical protein